MKKYFEIVKQNLVAKQECNILLIGDSITSAEWVHPNWRDILEYVLKEEMWRVLKKEGFDYTVPYWGIRCYNFGFDGAQSFNVLSKIHNFTRVNPDLSLIMMSRNDMDMNFPVDVHASNLGTLALLLKKAGSEVVYSTPQHELYDQLNKKYEPYRLAALRELKGKCDTLDLESEYSKFDYKSFYTFISEENKVAGVKEGEIDPSHPNMLGNAYIAKVFLDKLFGISFDPESYIKTLLRGDKFPKY